MGVRYVLHVLCSGIFCEIMQSSKAVSLPDNTIQTADLLVGVDSLVIEGHLLLERSPAVLHGHARLPPGERGG